MPTPDVDVARVLAALGDHRVDFGVIGGFTAELHDVAIPPTRDIDITPASGRANLERLARALRSIGARFRVSGGPPEGVEIPGGVTGDWLREMVSVAFVTEAGPVDVNLRPDGTDGYGDLATSKIGIEYHGRVVPTAALEDVIRSKEASGRSKDIKVLPALRAHLRRPGR